jgi:MFS family permease
MTIFILCLIFFNVLAVQETVTTPLVCDHDERFTESFDWSVTGSYVMYAGSGLFTIVAFILMHLTSGKIDDRVFCVIGLIIGIVGFVLMIDFEERVIWYPAFFVGYALISMSFPIGRIVTLSMLSKIIGPAKAGGYMGWYLCIGAIARCVGPYWAVNALLISVRVCFGSTTIFMVISMIILWLTWKNCRPHPEFIHEDDPPIEAKSEKTE